MNRNKLTQALFGALTLAAACVAHARPMVIEPRDDITFSALPSKAVPGRSLNTPSLGLAGRWTTGNGHLDFGNSRPGIAASSSTTSLINSPSSFDSNHKSFDGGAFSGFGWDADSQAGSNDNIHHDHELVDTVVTESTWMSTGAIDGMTFADVRADGVSPTPAVPEPSTYAMLAAGLAGIALFTRRRRAGRPLTAAGGFAS